MLIAILLFQTTAGAPDTLALSLAQARARARADNPALRAEWADARAAAQGPRETSRAFLPTVSAGLEAVRTTDPVAVFGMKLRQGDFAAGDLALDALNRPAAYQDYTARLTVEQPLLSLEGLYGHAAAGRAADARAAAARRAAGATDVAVIRSYWDAQLAAERVAALDTGIAAARAQAQRAEALHGQGQVSGLDARLARLRAAALEARRLGAVAEAENARAALRALLALPDATPLTLTDALGDAPLDDTLPAAAATTTRADVEALALGERAAALGIRRAWAQNLPSIAAFGSLAGHSRPAPFGAGSGDWTVGVALVWRPFAGLAGVGAVARARAEHDAASARREAADRAAELEIGRAARLHGAALRAVAVATDALREATEALAQAELRYRTGAAPITEVLDVQTALTNARLDLLAARHDVLVMRSAYDFANGALDQ
jgi:outer membrane protein TolC